MVTNVVEAEYGAHPTSSSPIYGYDKDHLQHYSETLDDQSWEQYFIDYINLNYEDYIEAVGGEKLISSLENPVF